MPDAKLTRSYLAEWYWPGVHEDALGALIVRTEAAALQLREQGRPVTVRGTILVRPDETVFCLFEGEEAAIRAAGELAGLPFERILESVWVGPDGVRHDLKDGT